MEMETKEVRIRTRPGEKAEIDIWENGEYRNVLETEKKIVIEGYVEGTITPKETKIVISPLSWEDLRVKDGEKYVEVYREDRWVRDD